MPNPAPNPFETLRQQVLGQCRRLAAEQGFTPDLAEKALAKEKQAPDLAPVLFPGGVREIALAFAKQGDDQLLEEAARKKWDEQNLRLRERVEQALMARLELENGQEALLRRMTGFFALPPNAATGIAALAGSTDAIWQAAGDRPHGFDFYSKRALLMPVFAASLAVWLQDETDEKISTRAFARRRIAEVEQRGKMAGQGLGQIQEVMRQFWSRLGDVRYGKREEESAPKG